VRQDQQHDRVKRSGLAAATAISRRAAGRSIADLKADVDTDGRIKVKGRGLLLAGGNNIAGPPISRRTLNEELL
jgi:hypothetical protein